MQSANDATGADAVERCADALKRRAQAEGRRLFQGAVQPDRDQEHRGHAGFHTAGSRAASRSTVTATGKVHTIFMRIIGTENMNLCVNTEVLWGMKKLEVALALDNTGSMAAAAEKMTNLKTAVPQPADHAQERRQERRRRQGLDHSRSTPPSISAPATRTTLVRRVSCGTMQRLEQPDAIRCLEASRGGTLHTDKNNWNGCVSTRNQTITRPTRSQQSTWRPCFRHL